MNLKLSHFRISAALALIALLWLASCKPAVTKTWLYNGIYNDSGNLDFTEILNGNVKQLTIGDATTNDFYNVHFDGEGNMRMAVTKSTYISISEFTSDTTVNTDTAIYTIGYNNVTKKKTITRYFSSAYNHYGKDSISDIFRDTMLCELNKKGTLDCHSIHRRSGNVENETVYDKAGNLTRLKMIFLDTKVEPDIHEYKYDSLHRLIENKLRDEKHEALIKTSFKYIGQDAHGNWTKREAYHQNFWPMEKYSRTDTVTRTIAYY